MRVIEPGVWVAGQISPDEVTGLASAGVATLLNNRPDHEEPHQPTGSAIAAAASAAGIAYAHAPIVGGIAPEAITAMRAALAAGPVVAFCKSGMRSAALWAVARAEEGRDADELIAAARHAGHELGGLRAMLLAAAPTKPASPPRP